MTHYLSPTVNINTDTFSSRVNITMQATPLTPNCGYARTAVRELSIQHKGQNQQRADAFQEQFKCSNFAIPEHYFQQTKHGSIFNRHSNRIVEGFSKRWHPTESKKQYQDTFLRKEWDKITEGERGKHTMSSCSACALGHDELQTKFPLKPTYKSTATLDTIYDNRGASRREEASSTRQVLTTLNQYHKQAFGRTVTESIVSLCPEEGIVKKLSDTQRKQNKENSCGALGIKRTRH